MYANEDIQVDLSHVLCVHDTRLTGLVICINNPIQHFLGRQCFLLFSHSNLSWQRIQTLLVSGA